MTQAQDESAQVTVVGAGIIGLSCALYLQRAGFTVTLIDRQGPGEGCSYGNCGGIAVTEFMPLSQPGHLLKVPGWLLDPLGPLAIKWSYLPQLAPWLLRFISAGRKARVDRAVAAATALCHAAWDDFPPLLKDAGSESLIMPEECLSLYSSDAELRADQAKLDACARHGLALDVIPGHELRQMEPDLAPDFAWGVLNRNWRNVADPYRLSTDFAALFQSQGGRILRAAVAGIEVSDGRAARLHCEGADPLETDNLVIAAGARSHLLARQLGDVVPLEADRGYSITVPDAGVSPRRQIVHGAAGLAITPMAMGLRIGGSVELAGLAAPPNYRRIDAQIARAKRVYPNLRAIEGERWMGHRPAMPDSLPVIGRATKVSNAYYAFGHGHLGLTWGPTTGRLIGELVAGAPSAIDLDPFRPDRFQ